MSNEDAAREVQEEFDLDDFLNEIPRGSKIEKIYTNRDLGEELGGTEEVFDGNGFPKSTRRWGLLGEADLLRQERELLSKVEDPTEDVPARITEIDTRIREIGARAAEILEEMDQTALTFEVQYVPPIIVNRARKDARKHLGMKGRFDPNHENAEDYEDEFVAQVLTSALVSVTKADGAKNNRVTVEGARSYLGKLPAEAKDRLKGLVEAVVFRSAIADNLALDPDF